MVMIKKGTKMQNTGFRAALPFWISLTMVAVVILSAYLGDWWLLLTPAYSFWGMAVIDRFVGLDLNNKSPDTPVKDLFWYRFVTLIWFPIEFVLVFAGIAFVSYSDHLIGVEKWFFMMSIGLITGATGIVYAHELMHRKSKIERHLGDALMALALYGHFRSEHLLVHHSYVGTPKDAVTARYNEGFHRFLPRVLLQCFSSAWNAEKAMLARKKLTAFHPSNPFWKYATLQLIFLLIAFVVAGWLGVAFFIVQALIAITLLEATNYVEHYGLTREYLGDGKYEHVKPHHSWNSAYKVTNYLLINLQRHSDHHYKPNRPYPLLQNYTEDEAPQLPRGYTLMVAVAMFPPLWKKIMNPRVKAWRRQFYPDIENWHDYNKALNPIPK